MFSQSEFRKKMRSARPPIAVDFDLDAFTRDVKDIGDQDPSLAATAFWLYVQSKSYREMRQTEPLVQLNARTSTLLAIAFLNREFSIVGNRLRKRTDRARRNGAASTEHLSYLPIGNDGELGNVDAGSTMDAATDVANLWLREALKSNPKNDATVKPIDIIRQYGRHYSMRNGHNELWTRALWENWGNRCWVKRVDSKFSPADKDFLPG